MTEDEKVQLQREAFVDGAYFEHANWGTGCIRLDPEWRAEAARRYPLPRKPRVVRFDGMEAAVIDGKLQFRLCESGRWWESTDERLTTDAIKKLAGLITNPWEEP